ncbi:MAG: DUF6484 domain-containing protein [Myxococcota bacterium]
MSVSHPASKTVEILPNSTLRAASTEIGWLRALRGDGVPLVQYPEGATTLTPARTTIALTPADIGCELVLTFQSGRIDRPIILGKLLDPAASPDRARVLVDGDTLILQANQRLELRCGKATLVLTRAGKVLTHGRYISTRAAGTHRIKGGSVQIN